MKATTYFHTLEGAIALNRFLRWTCLSLAVTVLILASALAFRREAVVLVPPTINSEARIGVSSADSEMQVAWGLYLATLMGNVTPNTAPFLTQKIGRNLSPRTYQRVVDAIEAQAKQVREQALSVSFSPQLARYDEKLQKVVVTGEVIVRDVRGIEARELRTYEMGFIVQNYTVLLDSLRTMQGPWAPATDGSKE